VTVLAQADEIPILKSKLRIMFVWINMVNMMSTNHPTISLAELTGV
jgi:hypothetical protein